jgi:hypothetical protein
VQDVQNAGIVELILQGEANKVKIFQGQGGFQGGEGKGSILEKLFHIGPGCESSFTGDLARLVENVVEDLKTEMGHSHLVDIRKGEGEFEADPAQILHHGVHLPAKVSGGFGNSKKVVFIHKKILTPHFAGGK